jgi:hypothetical protein
MFAIGLGLGIASRNTAPGAVSEAAVAALGPVALYSFADTSSLVVGRNGTGGSPAVDGMAAIGLVLDRARMGGQPLAAFLAGRPELVLNGDFTAGTASWTAFNGAELTAVGGRMRVVRRDATQSPIARQTLTGLTVGRLYRVCVTVTALSGTTVGSVIVQGLASMPVSQPGATVSLLCVATATSHNLHLAIQGSSGAVGDFVEFDDVSVKEIPGSHLAAPADSARPVLVSDGGRLLARFDGVDDTLELAGLDLPSAYLALAVRTTDGAGVAASGERASGQTAPFYAAWEAGNLAGTTTDDVVIGGTLSVPRTASRDALATALADGTARIVELVGSDFGGLTRWRLLNLPSNAAFNMAGDLAGAVLFASVPSAAHRTVVRGWLAGLSGATDVATVAPPPAPAYDAYVDAVAGSDANPGTAGQPFATLDRLGVLAAAAAPGTTQRYLVRAGTYRTVGGGQSFLAAVAARFELTFEPGSSMVCESGLVTGPRGIDARGSASVVVHGNGLLIQDYDGFNGGAWGNAVSAQDSAEVAVYDATIVNAGDGVSLHDTSRGHFERLHISNCRKGNFAHVGASVSTHVDCTFIGRTGAENGVGSLAVETASADFLRCTFVPVADGQPVLFNNATVRDCTIGTLASFVVLSMKGSTLTDSFVHARMNLDAASGGVLRRCFGHLAMVHRAGGTGLTIENSIFARLASALQPSVYYSGVMPAAGSPVTIRDTVLSGFTTAIGHAMDATAAQQAVTAGLTLDRLAFWGNTTNIDADLVAAAGFVAPAGTVTADPRLGPRTSTARSAWGLLAGSPCLGAGTAGGDIGFAA